MLGLLRGTVVLCTHDAGWIAQAEQTIAEIKSLLGAAAIAVEHVGSTSVPGLAAKPILDLVIGVRELSDLDPYVDKLAQMHIREAGQDLPDQRLFVMGDFEKDTRTHHIHAVRWDSAAWKNYIRFRDYLRAFDEKRMVYESEKRRLAALYSQDRQAYTHGKAELIGKLLEEANRWAERSDIDG